MKIYGIVAEFNPFHNGHKYLIDSIKNDDGNSAVVAVMSGNFVQRGEPAIISKFARAKSAIMCGVDLVIELPVAYSISTAMHFAGGSIDLLGSLGVVDTICFGSECGDIEKLKATSKMLNHPDMSQLLKKELNDGTTFAAARQTAAEKLFPNEDMSVLNNPNDTLALEYIAAAERLKYNFDYKVIKRIGPPHDSEEKTDEYCSASSIRNLLKEGNSLSDLKEYLPDESLKVLSEEISFGRISDYSLLDRAIVAHLRTATPEYLKTIPDVNEGLENRILLAANKYSTLPEILSAIKSKRYTLARLRRIILASYLGVTRNYQVHSVPYIKILALNEKGADVLKLAKNKSKLNIVGSAKEAERLDNISAEYSALEVRAGDIYSLTLKNPTVGKTEYTGKLYKTF